MRGSRAGRRSSPASARNRMRWAVGVLAVALALTVVSGLLLVDAVRDVAALARSQQEQDAALLAQVSGVIAEQQGALALLLASLVLTVLVVALAVRQVLRTVVVPLGRLADDASAVAEGDLERRLAPVAGVLELVRVADGAEAMRRRLLHERSLAARRSLITGQEDERRRVAAGIHDDTVQAVLAAALRLQRLRRRLPGDGEEAALLADVQRHLDEAISRLRRTVFELHPPTLDSEGLEAAVRLYLAETLDPLDVAWTVRADGDPGDDPAVVSLAYRLFREAVHNVVAHSRASRVDVRIRGAPGAGDGHGGQQVVLEVADDGVGFDPGHVVPVPGHLGLGEVRRLCRAAGGDLEVDSVPGRGTTVRVRLPSRLS